jgi:hypothetical protein
MVMKYIQLWTVLAFAPFVACATTQTVTEKQAQMDAADIRQSSASVAAYETPYQAFNTYFGFSNIFDLNGMMAAMTEEAKVTFFDGEVPSASEATAIGQAIQQEGHSTSTIESFYYTDDPTNPEIRATISSIHNQLKGTELLIIKYIDTAGGWKISEQEIISKSKTPVQP